MVYFRPEMRAETMQRVCERCSQYVGRDCSNSLETYFSGQQCETNKYNYTKTIYTFIPVNTRDVTSCGGGGYRNVTDN